MITNSLGIEMALRPGVCWAAVLADFQALIQDPVLFPSEEQLLLDVLAHQGRLHVASDDTLPHSMTPEDMSKSLAAQVLLKHTGIKHAEAIRQTAERAGPSLASLLRDVLAAEEEKRHGG